MTERHSENQADPLESLIKEGEALLEEINTPDVLAPYSYGSRELPSQISIFLGNLAGVIPADCEPEGTGRVTELVYRLTSIRRKPGQRLVSYVMDAIAERSRSRIFGLRSGEVLSSDRAVVRPAFGAPSPDDGRQFSVSQVLIHRDLTKI